MPTCEIEIVHLDTSYEDAASQERAELETQWEIQEHAETNRITFSMYSGSEWNSPLEVRDYVSDEQSGCFRIIRRFFMEAAGGAWRAIRGHGGYIRRNSASQKRRMKTSGNAPCDFSKNFLPARKIFLLFP